MNKKKSVGSGLGICGILTILFVVLKCFNLIDWPWWNFNPFAGSVLIFLVWDFWILIIFLVVLVAFLIADGSKRK